MLIQKGTTELRLPIEIYNANGTPALGLTHASVGLSLAYKLEGAASWNLITLVEGAGSYVSAGFRNLGEHVYEVCFPDNSYVDGETTLIRVIYDGVTTYDTISVFLDNVEGKIDQLLLNSSDLTFSFNFPGGNPLPLLEVTTVYVKEKGLVVVWNADIDIEAIPLQIIFEDPSTGLDFHVFEDVDLTKSGTTVSVTLPDSFTDEVNTFVWGVRNATTQKFYASGNLTINYAPFKDA